MSSLRSYALSTFRQHTSSFRFCPVSSCVPGFQKKSSEIDCTFQYIDESVQRIIFSEVERAASVIDLLSRQVEISTMPLNPFSQMKQGILIFQMASKYFDIQFEIRMLMFVIERKKSNYRGRKNIVPMIVPSGRFLCDVLESDSRENSKHKYTKINYVRQMKLFIHIYTFHQRMFISNYSAWLTLYQYWQLRSSTHLWSQLSCIFDWFWIYWSSRQRK